jgi:alkyldihydroxyacetonephosphate synthase
MAERRLKLCGWGFEGDGLTAEETQALLERTTERHGIAGIEPRRAPTLEAIELPKAKTDIPAALQDFSANDVYDRATHTYGKSYPDYLNIFDGNFANAPDFVAYPPSEEEVVAVLDWATGARVAVIPFGGGTSVVGGVEPAVGGGFSGAVSLDLTRLDRVLEVDRTSRAARMQGGIRVPAMEAVLKQQGLTLRHFPQSLAMATLGGMIATRSGGHFATLYTHIDDFVESLRMVTPNGAMESRRLPGSGAGPSPDRLTIGSEGALGIITEAWMRLQDRPTHRASSTVLFDDYFKAVEAVRAVSQAGLYPSNLRLLDAGEAYNNGFGDGKQSVLVLAFESADHPLDAWLARALEVCRDHGGQYDTDAGKGPESHRSGTAGAWRKAFIDMPHYRELLISIGVVADTIETAITWDRFPDFHEKVTAAAHAAIVEATGQPGTVTCRFTHVYPDGPAPYYSLQGAGRADALGEQWRHIKAKASDAVIEHGGTITHHHAVGRDHMPWYVRQRPDAFGAALAAAKEKLDPAGILNPGVIVPAA